MFISENMLVTIVEGTITNIDEFVSEENLNILKSNKTLVNNSPSITYKEEKRGLEKSNKLSLTKESKNIYRQSETKFLALPVSSKISILSVQSIRAITFSVYKNLAVNQPIVIDFLHGFCDTNLQKVYYMDSLYLNNTDLKLLNGRAPPSIS